MSGQPLSTISDWPLWSFRSVARDRKKYPAGIPHLGHDHGFTLPHATWDEPNDEGERGLLLVTTVLPGM
jgi:hypothetical protein